MAQNLRNRVDQLTTVSSGTPSEVSRRQSAGCGPAPSRLCRAPISRSTVKAVARVALGSVISAPAIARVGPEELLPR